MTGGRAPLLGFYLSHHPHAERDVAWLLDQRAGRDAHITEWEAWLRWNQPSTSHQRGDDPYEKA